MHAIVAKRNMGMALAGIAGALLAGCGGDDGFTPPPDANEVQYAVAVETVAPEIVRAGEPIHVDCTLLDEAGQELVSSEDPVLQFRYAPEGAVELTDDGDRIATAVGDIEVSCVVPSLDLVDDSPALLRVEPGEVASLVTHVDRDLMTAGETATAHCDAFDAYGNWVEDAAPSLRASPELPGNRIEGLEATLTGAGIYELACDLPAVETSGATLEVLPGWPAALVVSPVPDRAVYARGEIIELAARAVDRYENVIPDAQLQVASAPAADVADGARFRYFANGRYELTATAVGPTDGDVSLAASASVLIDGSGPEIGCDQPSDGAILQMTPGGDVAFSGSVADLSGVTQVRVNGTPVPVDAGGSFAATLPTEFGINFVDLSAVDEFGRESSRVCSFLVAERWATENRGMSGAVSMNLRQASVDDGSRTGPPRSLGDVFHTVLNSAGLKQTIHELFLSANPLKDSCDQTVFGACVFRSRMDYLSSSFPSVNTVSLDLVSGGISTRLRLNDVALRLRIRATGGVDTTGWVTVDSAEVRLTFNTTLGAGRPRITIRSGSVSTSVGAIDTDFDGADGWIIDNIIVPVAEGTIRDLVANQVSSLIRNQVGDALDGIVANLDISALATSFDVPRLDGGAPIRMTFTPGFSHVNATDSRLLFGLGTELSAPAAHARPSLGAPVQAPPGPLDPAAGGAAAIAIHSGVVGQALHALWRGGLFDATLTGGGSFPDGASVTLRTGLPPAVRLVGSDRLELALGNVAVSLVYPGVFSEPLDMLLGMRATVRYRQVGSDIVFSDFALEELYFTSFQVSIDAGSRDIIEEFLADVLGGLVGDSLNDALPALPIPSFTLPASLSEYGLPAGAVLGLSSPTLSAAIPQLVLAGALSIE